MSDNELVLFHTRHLWENIFPENGCVFITGATGFFGKNLLESFVYINDKLELNANVIALTRNANKFLIAHPEFDNSCIQFVEGDLATFSFPESKIDYIIHAANDFSTIEDDIEIERRTPVVGTKRVLELAVQKQVKALLHTSSGAVYGQMPLYDLIKESQHNPDENKVHTDYYSQNKTYIENMCVEYHKKYNAPSKIARCFAFVGPHLALDIHYAIGNFIKHYIDNTDIVIKGNGLVYRSYLYAADLCIWLWTILLKGKVCEAYNVGSDEYFSLFEIAQKVKAYNNSNIEIEVLDKTNLSRGNWYIPSIEIAKNELGLEVYTNLEEAIKKTIEFNSVKKHL